MRHVLSWLVVLGVPSVTLAADAKPMSKGVEHLLPADALFYVRYDGYEVHRKAYDRTALGQAMKGDLGEFLEHGTMFLMEALSSGLREKNPQAAQKLSASREKLLNYLWKHGLAASLEVGRLPSGAANLPLLDLPVRARLTVVFPEGGTPKNRALLLPLLTALIGDDKAIKKRQVGTRTLHEFGEKEGKIVWWQEDRHLLLVATNEGLEPVLEVIQGKRPSLLTRPLFQRVAAFQDYETDLRGFVDLAKIVDLIRTPREGSAVEKLTEGLARGVILQQIGVTGLKTATFHLGFDRQYQRSTVVVEVVEPAQRTGLLRLVFAPVSVDAAQLPAMPPDVSYVRASAVDWPELYRTIKHLASLASFAQLVGGGGGKQDLLTVPGVDLPKDILAHLDSTLVFYRSPSEGPFILGQVVAIKVKDEAKLVAGMQKLTAALTKLAPGLEVQTRSYRGVDLVMPTVPLPIPLLPTYTIHKGWLVLGVFPQPVKGFVLRSEGSLKKWTPPPLVAEALAQARKRAGPRGKLAALTVSDPRSSVSLGLSVLPIIARAATGGELSFDTAKIPNAQAVTDWQFPGVCVFYDDGNALRWEDHFSIDIPGELFLGFYALGSAFF